MAEFYCTCTNTISKYIYWPTMVCVICFLFYLTDRYYGLSSFLGFLYGCEYGCTIDYFNRLSCRLLSTYRVYIHDSVWFKIRLVWFIPLFQTFLNAQQYYVTLVVSINFNAKSTFSLNVTYFYYYFAFLTIFEDYRLKNNLLFLLSINKHSQT